MAVVAVEILDDRFPQETLDAWRASTFVRERRRAPCGRTRGRAPRPRRRPLLRPRPRCEGRRARRGGRSAPCRHRRRRRAAGPPRRRCAPTCTGAGAGWPSQAPAAQQCRPSSGQSSASARSALSTRVQPQQHVASVAPDAVMGLVEARARRGRARCAHGGPGRARGTRRRTRRGSRDPTAARCAAPGHARYCARPSSPRCASSHRQRSGGADIQREEPAFAFVDDLRQRFTSSRPSRRGSEVRGRVESLQRDCAGSPATTVRGSRPTPRRRSMRSRSSRPCSAAADARVGGRWNCTIAARSEWVNALSTGDSSCAPSTRARISSAASVRPAMAGRRGQRQLHVAARPRWTRRRHSRASRSPRRSVPRSSRLRPCACRNSTRSSHSSATTR